MPLLGRTSRADRFDKLVRGHVATLYKAAYRFVGNPDDAEDLVQDVLTKLYPRTDEMTKVAELRPWLLRVLYHQFIDNTRKQARRPVTVHDDAAAALVADRSASPEQVSLNRQATSRLDAALSQLKEDQRALITLHLQQGFTLEELTHVLDAPLGTLKSKLHRTRAQLRKLLGDATFSNDPA